MWHHAFACMCPDVLEKPAASKTQQEAWWRQNVWRQKQQLLRNVHKYFYANKKRHTSKNCRLHSNRRQKSDIIERACTLLRLTAWSSSPLDGIGPQIHCCVPDSPILLSLGSEDNTNWPPLTAAQVEHAKQIAWFCGRHLRPRLI